MVLAAAVVVVIVVASRHTVIGVFWKMCPFHIAEFLSDYSPNASSDDDYIILKLAHNARKLFYHISTL